MIKGLVVYKKSKSYKYFELYKKFKKGYYVLVAAETNPRFMNPQDVCRILAKAPIEGNDSEEVKGKLYDIATATEGDEVGAIISFKYTPKTITYNITDGQYFISDVERLSYTYDVPQDEIDVLYTKISQERVVIGLSVEGSTEHPAKEYLGQIYSAKYGKWNDKKSDDKPSLKDQIIKFLEKTSYMEFHNVIAKRVLGQPALYNVTLGVYTYLKSIAEGRKDKANILLAGGSGTGKTETFRAMKDYFADEIPTLPILQFDASSLTSSGYKGDSPDTIMQKIAEAKTDGIAIMYVDEIDKRLGREVGSSGFNYNAATQSELLTMVEGYRYNKSALSADTSNTLFIFGGSFEDIRKKRAVKTVHIGFNQESEYGKGHSMDITRDEIIGNGALIELVGRLPILVNYHALDAKTMQTIIDRKVAKVGEMLGVSVNISESYKEQLVGISESKFGARTLETAIFEPAFNAYSEAMQSGLNNDEFVINLLSANKYEIEKKVIEKPKDKCKVYFIDDHGEIGIDAC